MKEISYGMAILNNVHNEDFFDIKFIDNIYYFAIFDGHGSQNQYYENQKIRPKQHVGAFCRDYFIEFIHSNIVDLITNRAGKTEIENEIINSFVDFDQILFDKNIPYGATCGLLIIDIENKNIYQVNLGDSPSLIVNSEGKIISETIDHDVTNPIELKRVHDRGGFVRGKYFLSTIQLGRSFGDFHMKKTKDGNYTPTGSYLISIPDIKITKLKSNLTIILCSDGLLKDSDTRLSLVKNVFRLAFCYNSPFNSSFNSNLYNSIALRTIKLASKYDDKTLILIHT